MTLEEALAEITRLNTELTASKSELTASKSEIATTKKALNTAESRVTALETEVTQLTSAAEETATTHAAEVQRLTDEGIASAAAANIELVNSELRLAAQAAGMHSPGDVVRFLKAEDFKRGDNGQLEGVEEAVTELRNTNAYLFQTTDKQGTQPTTSTQPRGTTATPPAPRVPPAPGTVTSVANLSDSDYALERERYAPGYRPTV